MSTDPGNDAYKKADLNEEQLENVSGGRLPLPRQYGKDLKASVVDDDTLEGVSGGRPESSSLKMQNREAIPTEPPNDRPPTG